MANNFDNGKQRHAEVLEVDREADRETQLAGRRPLTPGGGGGQVQGLVWGGLRVAADYEFLAPIEENITCLLAVHGAER